LQAVDGVVTLDVSPSPLYVRGLSPKLYPLKQTIEQHLLAELYPGDSKMLPLTDTLKNAEITGVFGDVQASVEQGKLAVKVASDCSPGLVGMMLKTGDAVQPVVKWFAVRQSLELVSSQLKVDHGKLVQVLTLHNHAQQTLAANLVLQLDNKVQSKIDVSLDGGIIKQLQLPLSLDSTASPTRTWTTQLTISSPTTEPMLSTQTFNLLAAHEIGTSTEGKFNNTAQWSGQGASGKTDQAAAQFTWQSSGLVMDVTVHDDVFDQRMTDGIIWQQDSLQFAFDTDPDLTEVYEPLAGIFTKKLCRLAFALTPNGPLAWRHTTHNDEQLPLGEITREFDMTITRDEQTRITQYHLLIPWQQIGLDSVKPGKAIGISILVNDSDGPQTKRAMYELFNSLTTRLPKDNGRLLLQ
jgi:hypothetical protein